MLWEMWGWLSRVLSQWFTMCVMLHNKICLGEPVDADEISENVKIQLMKLT